MPKNNDSLNRNDNSFWKVSLQNTAGGFINNCSLPGAFFTNEYWMVFHTTMENLKHPMHIDRIFRVYGRLSFDELQG